MTRAQAKLTIPTPNAKGKTSGSKKGKSIAPSSSRITVPERGIVLTSEKHGDIEVWLSDAISEMGWEVFEEPPDQACSELVTTFLRAYTPDDFLYVHINGVRISFPEEEINETYNLTPVQVEEDEFGEEEEEEEEDEWEERTETVEGASEIKLEEQYETSKAKPRPQARKTTAGRRKEEVSASNAGAMTMWARGADMVAMQIQNIERMLAQEINDVKSASLLIATGKPHSEHELEQLRSQEPASKKRRLSLQEKRSKRSWRKHSRA